MDTSLLWEIIEILYLNENEPMTVLDLKRELDPGRDRSITKRDINRVLYYKRGTVFQTCGNSPGTSKPLWNLTSETYHFMDVLYQEKSAFDPE